MRPMIIFVDDSETALASTKSVTQDMDVDIKQYLSAVDALHDLQSESVKPDLIVTDLNMPVMDGFEFLEEVRKIKSLDRVPTLMLTTESDGSKKQKGRALGLTGWIVKPFNTKQFKDAISRVLRLR
jgi:two-component system chemotaxis response regulator CheY